MAQGSGEGLHAGAARAHRGDHAAGAATRRRSSPTWGGPIRWVLRHPARHASDWGCPDYACAVVQGDDVTDIMRAHPELPLMEDGAPLESLLPRMASANAYLGADVVAQAFATGAELVITGRVADPALFLGPMLHAFGWSYDDYPKLANGRLPGICSNVRGSSPAAVSPIRARRRSRILPVSATRWPMCGRTGASRCPKRQVPVDGSTSQPAPNNCCMKCTIPLPTSRPIACLMSPP